MTNYEKITSLLRQGHKVDFFDGSWWRRAVAIQDGRIITSNCVEEREYLDESYSSTGRLAKEINEIEITKIIPVANFPELLKVGDKVGIIEGTKEFMKIIGEWDDLMEDFIKNDDLTMTVIVNGYYGLKSKKHGGCWFIPFSCVYKKEDEKKEEVDILIKNGKKYRVQILEEIK